MAVFEIQGPDGKVYEVDAPDAATAAAALANIGGPKPDPNWRDQQMPEGMALNEATGQVEDMRSPINPNIPTGTAAALGIGAGQGLGFGSFDEVVAAGRAATGDSGYDYELARMREAERRAQEDNAGAYYGGMIPGAVASSVSAGKALGINPQGANLLGTMGRGAGIGAGEGALWGFNTGEGGAANRFANAGKTAAVGSATGFAAPAVVAGGAKAVNVGRDLIEGGIDTAIRRGNTGRANRAIMETLNRSGRSLDDVADDVARAAAEGQPEFRLMDAMGTAGQRRASGVVRSGGDGAEEIARFLQTRQVDQPNRVAGFVEDAFDMRGTTAAKTRDALTTARGAAADTAYAAARGNAAPVDVRGALAVIDDRIGGMQGSNVAGDGIDGTLARFRSRLAANTPPKGTTAVELSDFDRVLGVKQDVQDAIGVAVRAGRNNEARELGKVVSALDAALEASSDGYRAANDGFREASRVIGAVDDGASMARPGARAADTVPAFQAMTPDQQAAARVGYGDRALARIEANTSPTANVAKPFTSTKAMTEADAMAVDSALFRNRIGREGTMWETQNRALGGSRTADNLQDIANIGPLANVGRAIADAANLKFGSAAQNLGAAVGPAVTGMNEPTRALIARMLMSDNPRQSLAAAMRQETTSQGRRRIAEAMMRALGREVTP